MVIEPRTAGRMFEDGGTTGEAMWGHVSEWVPAKVLGLTGHTSSRWG